MPRGIHPHSVHEYENSESMGQLDFAHVVSTNYSQYNILCFNGCIYFVKRLKFQCFGSYGPSGRGASWAAEKSRSVRSGGQGCWNFKIFRFHRCGNGPVRRKLFWVLEINFYGMFEVGLPSNRWQASCGAGSQRRYPSPWGGKASRNASRSYGEGNSRPMRARPMRSPDWR